MMSRFMLFTMSVLEDKFSLQGKCGLILPQISELSIGSSVEISPVRRKSVPKLFLWPT